MEVQAEVEWRETMLQAKYYRTVWISDVHLGTRACKASSLVGFLRSHIADTLYLVGDIVDGWNWGPAWHWDGAQEAVVKEIVRWRRFGARVVFLPGNHDETKLHLVEELFGPIPSTSSLLHTTASGARILVIHGHQFDGSLNPNRLLPILGASGYARAQRIHEWYHREQRLPCDDNRSLSDYFRYPAKKAVEFLTDFPVRAVLAAARDHKADGVVCGHIHRSAYRSVGNVLYVNDGDWVQNRTAAVEERDGTLQVIRWNPLSDDDSPREPVLAEAVL
jgi:UDP-2,3-diacylglucosamine pyrophosphatase LpxH